MARKNCTICQREDKDEIESMFVEKGARGTARFIGCSHNAVLRHMENHTPKTPIDEGTNLPDPWGARTLLEEDEQLVPAVPIESGIKVEDASYKGQKSLVASLKTPQERKAHVMALFQQGRFHGMRTTGFLSAMWSDLGPIEFAELISQVALEVNFRRGSEQARRLVLLGKVETLFNAAMKAKDLKTAARLLETWAKLDVSIGADLLTALASTASWPLVARELQMRFPDAFEAVYGVLVAEEQRKRQAMAPPAIEASME